MWCATRARSRYARPCGIPLSDGLIDHMPFRRLNRYIRDAIKSGKMAVDIVWPTWSPAAGTELEHLMDLCKRKIRFLTGDERLKPVE